MEEKDINKNISSNLEGISPKSEDTSPDPDDIDIIVPKKPTPVREVPKEPKVNSQGNAKSKPANNNTPARKPRAIRAARDIKDIDALKATNNPKEKTTPKDTPLDINKPKGLNQKPIAQKARSPKPTAKNPNSIINTGELYSTGSGMPQAKPAAMRPKNSDHLRPPVEKAFKLPLINLFKKGTKPQNNEDGTKIEYRDKGGVFSTFTKTITYIVCILIVSGILASIGIKFGNDVFAFVKEDFATDVVIPEFATVGEVADILSASDIIKQPVAFKLYTGFKYRKTKLTFKAGVYTLNAKMNYDQIIYQIRSDKEGERKIVKISFPEGLTIDEMINIFISNGIGTKEKFVDVINNYDFNYKFMDALKSIELSTNRKYRLEGYLFPDTYEFYTDSTEVAAIDKMLYNFESRFDASCYDRLNELEMNIDQVITIASIVQKESKLASEFYTTSSVFHNRLNSNQFPKLQSDATIQYFLPEHVEKITEEIKNTDNPYNTYIYDGLPPSAICNPGIDAIMAALYPEDTNYYFFYAMSDGTTKFAKTYSEHLNNQNEANQ